MSKETNSLTSESTDSTVVNFTRDYFPKCLELMRKKNNDYAGLDEEGLGNITACDDIGLCKTEIGLLTRILDKIKRLGNAVNGVAMMAEEKIEDTWMDLVNYAVIGAYLHHKNRKTFPKSFMKHPIEQMKV